MFSRYYRLPNGVEKGYDIVDVGDVVCIVAITPDKKVVLVEEFRPGPEKILLEIPGGFVNPGEQWKEGAARELLEETGYAGEMKYVGSRWIGAYLDGAKHTFVAQNCVRVQDPAPDPDEFVETRLVSLVAFREWLRTSDMVDLGGAYQALDYLGEL